MTNEWTLSHIFNETALCGLIHVVFGIFSVEPVLGGIATAIKIAMGGLAP